MRRRRANVKIILGAQRLYCIFLGGVWVYSFAIIIPFFFGLNLGWDLGLFCVSSVSVGVLGYFYSLCHYFPRVFDDHTTVKILLCQGYGVGFYFAMITCISDEIGPFHIAGGLFLS